MIRARFWNIVGTVMYWTANKLWKLHAIAFGKAARLEHKRRSGGF